jgi:hypothetical protein
MDTTNQLVLVPGAIGWNAIDRAEDQSEGRENREDDQRMIVTLNASERGFGGAGGKYVG